jgi:hypothetical protein
MRTIGQMHLAESVSQAPARAMVLMDCMSFSKMSVSDVDGVRPVSSSSVFFVSL